MGRRTWLATVHGVTRVGHDLVTKPSPPSLKQQDLIEDSAMYSDGEGNGSPLQYSCLDNPVNGGAW